MRLVKNLEGHRKMVNKPKTYMGHALLKRSNQNIEWTKELLKEYIKCSQDPVYFVEHYVNIITESGLELMKLRDYQKEMIISFKENRNTVVCMARQSGKSTATTAFILWYVLFNDAKTVGILANKEETALVIFEKVRLAYQYLPMWLQQGVVEFNKGSMKLENLSEVVASATSGSAVRGYKLDILFIDETAHVENWSEFFQSVYPTISAGKHSKVILVSTPFGLNHYWQIWSNALSGKNNYNPILVTWDRVPGRDEAWKQETLKGMNFDLQQFDQEQNCSFQGSSGTLIAGWKLKELVAQTPLTTSEGLKQYKIPEKDKIYTMIVDVSRG